MDIDREMFLNYFAGQKFLFLSEQCLNLTKKALMPILKSFGLNHSTYLVLMILRYGEMNGQEVIATELSFLLGREKHTITPLVDSLAKGGFIERTRDETDRRAIKLTLTDKGRNLIGEVQPLTMPTVAEVSKGGGEDFGRLFATLESFRRNFAVKCGQDPELYSGAYRRLLVEGEQRLLEARDKAKAGAGRD